MRRGSSHGRPRATGRYRRTMRAALFVSSLFVSLTLGGCFSAAPDRSREEEDRRRWAELGLDVPVNRTPVFYDADGEHLPDVELDGFEEGFVHVPAAGDAGSFGLGDWYRFERARQLPQRLPGEPEPVLTRRYGPPEFRGLTRQECREVQAVLASSDDAGFDSYLGTLAASGAPRSILVITHVMFELPWEPELEPRHRGDLRMRKLRVESALDDLVASTQHDGLSARYFPEPRPGSLRERASGSRGSEECPDRLDAGAPRPLRVGRRGEAVSAARGRRRVGGREHDESSVRITLTHVHDQVAEVGFATWRAARRRGAPRGPRSRGARS